MNDHLYLAHHGIKGMKWGVRRYQNADGSLTSAGRKRYGVGSMISDSVQDKGNFVRRMGQAHRERKAVKKKYWEQRRKNVDKFYKSTGDYVHDKTRDQMTAKERKQYDKANAEYKKAQKQAGIDRKQGLYDARTKAYERRAEYYRNKSNNIETTRKNRLLARVASDSYRGTARIAEKRVKVRKARDAYRNNPSKETRRAYHRAVGNYVVESNFAYTPAALGAYERYRENGSNVVVSMLKAGYGGSLFRHSDL